MLNITYVFHCVFIEFFDKMDRKLVTCAFIYCNILRELVFDDDEIDQIDEQTVLEKTDHFAEFTIYNFNDNQFKQHFRLLPTTFEDLLLKMHQANDDLYVIHSGKPELSLEKQTLMMLWSLGNMESFRSVGDRFGVNKSCCWRVLYRTCHRLLKVNQRYGIISFPQGERALQIINSFHDINGFPGVLGVIDGCHIRIEKPKDHPNSYINRKGFPSVLLQAVCDHRKLFLDVYIGQPGSLNDARVFSKSDLRRRIQEHDVEFPEDSHLIGDLAYPLLTTLLVGFKQDRPRTQREINFNNALSKLRVVIETAFGLLKARFRRLKYMETKRIDLVVLLIMTACILHNVCILNKDFFHEIYYQDANEEDNDEIERLNPAAVAKRNNIANLLYYNNH